VFEKAKPERMPVRKSWDHAINLREDFIPRKKDIFNVEKRERESKGICRETIEKKVY